MRAGLPGRCSPHTLRHTFARAYLVNGGDAFSLQRILGHATLDMVKRYVALADTDVLQRHRMAGRARTWPQRIACAATRRGELGGRAILSGVMAWLMLAGAIASEITATLALKGSDGFRRPLPDLVVVAGYGVSFALLALVLRALPVGVVYAVWSAVGTVGVALLGVLLFGESMSLLKAGAIGIIVGGVLLLELAPT